MAVSRLDIRALLNKLEFFLEGLLRAVFLNITAAWVEGTRGDGDVEQGEGKGVWEGGLCSALIVC